MTLNRENRTFANVEKKTYGEIRVIAPDYSVDIERPVTEIKKN